jgi:hypothetical protein
VCIREDYLLSTKASAALKTAETPTHPLSCKMAPGTCRVEGAKMSKNDMKNEQRLFQKNLGAVVAARASTIGVESL